MAFLLDTTITGTLNVSSNVSVSGNLLVGGTVVPNTAANTVDVYANSGSLQTSTRLNFVNTSTVTVTVAAGSAGNANVSFTASGGSKVTTVTPSTDQNNYNPTGLAGTTDLRVNNSASIKITGLAAQTDGTQITITNASTDYLLWLEHENTSSTAANRFALPDRLPAFLMPGDSIGLLYNGTTSRWNVFEWGARGAGLGLTFLTDFIESTVGGMSTTFTGTGASLQGSTYLANATELPIGLTQLDTGTTATGKATLGNATTTQIVPGVGPALHVARLAVETLVSGTQTYNIFTGFNDSISTTSSNSIAWKYAWNTGAGQGEWVQSAFAAGVETTSTTNSPAEDVNYNWFVIFCNPGWTRADFITSADSKSFTFCNSLTTGLPSSTQPVSWVAATITKTVGTTQRNVSIDFAGYRVDGVRG